MRQWFLLFSVVLPLPLKLFFYRRCMGWKIGTNVRIGLSFIDGNHVVIEDNVVIGNFNIFKYLRHIQIGKGTFIQNFNQVFGRRDHPRWFGRIVIGENVNLMSHHFIDALGKVTIGSHTTIGGRDTQFWSHSLTYETSQPMLSPLEVSIGENVYIGARATLVGCTIPDQSVVGAGSVVTKHFTQEKGRVLIAGNPATIRKRYANSLPKLENLDSDLIKGNFSSNSN